MAAVKRWPFCLGLNVFKSSIMIIIGSDDYQFVSNAAPSLYLNECWLSINRILRIREILTKIQYNRFENAKSKIAATSFRLNKNKHPNMQ